MKRRSTGLMVGGIVLMGVGTTAVIMGFYLHSFTAIPTACDCSGDVCSCNNSSTRPVGIGMMVVGGLAIAAGIPMTIVGAKQVPVQPEPQTALVLGPGSMALRGRF